MHKNNIHALARAIIIDQDQILLCRKLDSTLKRYFLPGGHIEVGESAREAVVRELVEESGFEFQDPINEQFDYNLHNAVHVLNYKDIASGQITYVSKFGIVYKNESTGVCVGVMRWCYTSLVPRILIERLQLKRGLATTTSLRSILMRLV